MRPDYGDIVEKAGRPIWFDEAGVPRYGVFHPRRCLTPGVREAFLVGVRCDGCGQQFPVVVTWAEQPGSLRLTGSGGDLRALGYGLPPNIGCCRHGPEAPSITVALHEAWVLTAAKVWMQLDEAAVLVIGYRFPED